MNKGVVYLRASTNRQKVSGLGLLAQRDAIQRFVANERWQLLSEFAEIESGKATERPELQKALGLCQRENATLLIAKLDRLSRNAAFLLNLQESGVKFKAVDMPFADNFTIGILGLVAQKEREMISERTKAALAMAKRRGTRLGNPKLFKAVPLAVKSNIKRADDYARKIAPVVSEIQRAMVHSLIGIAQCLNARGYRTPNGKAHTAQSVKNALERMKAQGVRI